MRLLKSITASMAWVACSVFAQFAADNPDWKETEVPPPPAFSTSKLVALDRGPTTSLNFGVDPATLAISKDGIVRYVIVASNASGAMNAMYEGIRCATGEFKTYARSTTVGKWNAVQDPQWRSMYDNMPSRHALVLARQGVCNGRAPASSVEAIVRKLKYPRRSESP